MKDHDLHSAVRTAVDEARRLAQAATPGPWWFDESEHVWRLHGVAFVIPPQADGLIPEQVVNKQIVQAQKGGPCLYWPEPADAQHIAAWNPRRALAMCDWADDVLREHQRDTLGGAALAKYDECRCINAWPCIEVLRVAAAFGVETGETP